MKRLCASLVVSALLLAGSAGYGANVVIEDTEFDPADWSLEYLDYSINLEGMLTNSFVQEVVGGSNNVMHTTHAKTGTTLGERWEFIGMLIYMPEFYDPAVQGAIGAINYTFKQDRPTTNYDLTSTICLEQNGKYYVTTNFHRDLVQDGYFTTYSVSDLGRYNWVEDVPDNDMGTWIYTSHPDFSANGSPIRIGMMFLSSGTGTGTYTFETYYDDIFVEFVPATVEGSTTVEDIAAIPGATTIKIEDYVAPDPNVLITGEVASMPSPSTVFTDPCALLVDPGIPFPPAVGVIVEAESAGLPNDVGFYDASSAYSMSDLHGTLNTVSPAFRNSDKITIRFVNPANTSQGATVSRVGFYFGHGDAQKLIDVKFYDLGGNRLFTDESSIPPMSSGEPYNAQSAYIAYNESGVETSMIHKVEFAPDKLTAHDFWVLGGYVDTAVVDIAYYGLEYAQITVVSPNGGEELIAGQENTISWTHMGNIGDQFVDIDYFDGSDWVIIASGEANDGSYDWRVPFGVETDQARVRVRLTGDGIGDESDAVLRIYECNVHDLTGDCLVDLADFAELVKHWLQCGDPADPSCLQE